MFRKDGLPAQHLTNPRTPERMALEPTLRERLQYSWKNRKRIYDILFEIAYLPGVFQHTHSVAEPVFWIEHSVLSILSRKAKQKNSALKYVKFCFKTKI